MHDMSQSEERGHETTGDGSARTLLELLIRQRRMTQAEFAEYAEKFAREHHEPGTLSVRHLQRLVSGRRKDVQPSYSSRAQ